MSVEDAPGSFAGDDAHAAASRASADPFASGPTQQLPKHIRRRDGYAGVVTMHATDGRLEIRATFVPGVKASFVPMRTIRLAFANVSEAPLRLHLPRAEDFRMGISTVMLHADGGAPIMIPEPHPHGYVITEDDFVLLAPGQEHVATQSFTLDSMQPGGGNRTAHEPGYETGRTASVRWTYESDVDAWPGGGKKIEHIWTGKLVASGTWTVTE